MMQWHPRVNSFGVVYSPITNKDKSPAILELLPTLQFGILTSVPDPHPVKAQSSVPAEAPQFTKWTEVLVECIAAGMTPPQIAKRLEPEDKHKRRIVRKKIWRQIENSKELQLAIAQRSQAIMTVGLPSATKALMKRAQRGRPDAIKLAFEATGFHNPRVKHEHSGDIKITLDMPRPTSKSTVEPDDDVVDAEVVDED